jgi:hypothetical protein
LVVAAAAAPILLWGTTYLSDKGIPGTPEWTPAEAALILGGLAVTLAAVWGWLHSLARRAPDPANPLLLSVSCVAGSGAVMYFGYATGGQLGFPLAAALVGATLASLVLAGRPNVQGSVGVGIVGLFALLVVGRFFGKLTTPHAAGLFALPLLAGLRDMLPILRNRPLLRKTVRAGLALTLAGVIVGLVWLRTAQSSQAGGGASSEFESYMELEK